MNSAADLQEQKQELRRAMRLRRVEAFAANPYASLTLRDHFLAGIELPKNSVIAGYTAIDHEIDPLPLMQALHERGHKLALPVVDAPASQLIFRQWAPGDKLAIAEGPFKIPEPAVTAPRLEPDLLLVPLLAFDMNYNRLGRGGGYYDRALATLHKQRKILAIGLAFACQQAATVPVTAEDSKLDKIVTESGIF